MGPPAPFFGRYTRLPAPCERRIDRASRRTRGDGGGEFSLSPHYISRRYAYRGVHIHAPNPSRAGARTGGLIDVIGDNPGLTRCVQITSEDVAHLTKTDDREPCHVRPAACEAGRRSAP